MQLLLQLVVTSLLERTQVLVEHVVLQVQFLLQYITLEQLLVTVVTEVTPLDIE